MKAVLICSLALVGIAIAAPQKDSLWYPAQPIDPNTVKSRHRTVVPIGDKLRAAIHADQAAKRAPVTPARHGNDGSSRAPAVCGQEQKKNNDGKIVGGNEASPNQFPWVSHLQCQTSDGTYVCTSAIVSNNTILTAGHCVEGCDSFTITVGAHNWREPEPGAMAIDTTDFILHEAYNPSLLLNDIAVVFLPEDIAIDNEKTMLSCLPTYADNQTSYAGEMVTGTGWGATKSHGGQVSDVLMYVEGLPVITKEECHEDYTLIPDSMLCTSTEQGTGICGGDSGGPLNYYDTALGAYKQIGLVSFGSSSGCATGYADGFTRVTHFLDWIAANTDIVIDAE